MANCNNCTKHLNIRNDITYHMIEKNFTDDVIQHITISKPLFQCPHRAVYFPKNKAIQIILRGDIGVKYSNCTDNEIMTYVISEINHEMIHYVIHKYVDFDASARYDLIAIKTRTHDFRGIKKIMEKLGLRLMSRHQLKRRYGIIAQRVYKQGTTQ